MPQKRPLGVDADFFYGIMFFSLLITLVDLEKKCLGRKMGFANILQSKKNRKKGKYLKLRVALGSLKTVWQVFDTFFSIFQAKQNWEV